MRLSTLPTRSAAAASAVIHAALDAGATLLDTADVYCFDESEIGHNERLVADALRQWPGDRATLTVATKGGLRRVGRAWVPDGRARHLRAACEASRRALGCDVIDLYQLHAIDPRTPLETSVRALAALQHEGSIHRIGLCNVNVGQIEAARRIAPIDSVQVSLSVLDDENLRNGVAEYCRDEGIQLIAYRPLGGERAARLGRDPVLAEVASRHDASAQEVALAWLLDLDAHVVPVPGATQEANARSLGGVRALRLTPQDRAALDARFPAGRLLRVPRSARRPPDDSTGDVVLVMGMPGAGKSNVALELAAHGYERLNRDELGGRLSDLVSRLDHGLAEGRRHWVLDNTYATRASRNEVIECAWRHGVPVRCLHLVTSLADAQINAITRLVEVHGRLPTPEELRERGREDARWFGPDAQFRYERTVEPPVPGEGFSAIERRTFRRRTHDTLKGRAIILEYDEVLCTSRSGATAVLAPDDVAIAAGRRETLARYQAEGWHLFAHAWRPQIEQGVTDAPAMAACFARTRSLLGLDIDIACCPHAAGPPACWCRKPLPGLVLEFVLRRAIALRQCMVVGRSAADRTLAEKLGVPCHEAETFFAPPASR
jgi:aryl-alcohol dehydrogenase-like predicted oxidoreductase/histidinol phosphatase-like enzyme